MTEREQQELARIIVERNSGKNQFAGLVGVVCDHLGTCTGRRDTLW